MHLRGIYCIEVLNTSEYLGLCKCPHHENLLVLEKTVSDFIQIDMK